MQQLHSGYARAFNKRHQRRGAVFESRFRSAKIVDTDYLIRAIRYVALNPVAAGVVSSPEQWSWSTYAQIVGTQRCWPFFDPQPVVELFGGIDHLRASVCAGLPTGV
jgi:hypothetical protein